MSAFLPLTWTLIGLFIFIFYFYLSYFIFFITFRTFLHSLLSASFVTPFLKCGTGCNMLFNFIKSK